MTNNPIKSCKTIVIRGVYLCVSVNHYEQGCVCECQCLRWGKSLRGEGGGSCQLVSYRALDLHLLMPLPKLLGGLVGISDPHLRGQ